MVRKIQLLRGELGRGLQFWMKPSLGVCSGTELDGEGLGGIPGWVFYHLEEQAEAEAAGATQESPVVLVDHSAVT